MFAAPGKARSHYAKTYQELASMAAAQFQELRQLADSSFLLQGITFTVCPCAEYCCCRMCAASSAF